MKREIRFATAGILALLGTRIRGDEDFGDPAGLVRAVIANENKIHDLKSLLLRIEGVPKRSAAEPSAEVRPKQKETLELAFDRSRLRYLHDRHDASTILGIWDGRQARIHTRFHTHDQESYTLDESPEEHFVHLESLLWLRAGAHSFWWNSSKYKVGGVSFYVDRDDKWRSIAWGTPEDFLLNGRQVFRERDCHVLDFTGRKERPRRLYVGTEGRLLRGEAHFRSPPAARRQGIMGLIAGAPIKDDAEWTAWLERLSPAHRRNAERQYLRTLYTVAEPSVEWYFDDYREVSPGFSIPMRFGYTFLKSDAEGVRVKSRRDLRVVEVKVDAELPDEMFVMEMREGVTVCDMRYDPPLSYPFKKHRSQEEWQEILDEYKRKVARQARDSEGDRPRPAATRSEG